MLDLFFTRKKKARKAAEQLYASCVHQARNPVFFAQWGVPDTLTGRFDVVSLHVALVILALNDRVDRESSGVAQALFDVFFLDMDRSARERGVGDLAVPHHIKRMMAAFNGRLHAYRDDDRIGALIRNVYGTVPTPDTVWVMAFAAYTHEAQKTLAQNTLAAGEAIFPSLDPSVSCVKDISHAA